MRILHDEAFSKEAFDKLLNIYHTTKDSDFRGEWLLGGYASFLDNPVTRAMIVYGDLAVNPGCAADYKNAPVILHGITELAEFQIDFIYFG